MPGSVSSSAPVTASQTFAVWSLLAVTMRDPSGLNAAAVRLLVCPRSVSSSAPVTASQTFAVLAPLAVTIRVPSGLSHGRDSPQGQHLGTGRYIPDLRGIVPAPR